MNRLQTRLRRLEKATPGAYGSLRVVLEPVGAEAKADRQQAELEAQAYTDIAFSLCRRAICGFDASGCYY